MNTCKGCIHANTAFCENVMCVSYNYFEQAPIAPTANDQSIKSDANKYQPSLVPIQGIKDVAEVRAYGVAKYGSYDNWKQVAAQRYIDALYRHLLAMIEDPQSKDEESGIEHYKHVACNAMFLCEVLKNGNV